MGGGGRAVVECPTRDRKVPGSIPGGAKQWMHVCKYLPLLSCVLCYIMCLIVVSVCTASSNSASVWLLTLPWWTTYVYSLCVGLFYYSVLSCVADVADCPLQRLSAIVIQNIIIIIIIHSFVLLYKAMDRPHLEYATSVWFPYKNEILKLLKSYRKELLKLLSLKHLPYA